MKRTPLKRKTPLRAKKRINQRSVNKPALPTAFREAAFLQSAGRCDLCGVKLDRRTFKVHHVFYKSHVAPPLGHELWNRACLHDECHRVDSKRATPHNAMAVRWKLEELAFLRLWRSLTRDEQLEVQRRIIGTSHRHYVQAYEEFRRSQRVLHAGKVDA